MAKQKSLEPLILERQKATFRRSQSEANELNHRLLNVEKDFSLLRRNSLDRIKGLVRKGGWFWAECETSIDDEIASKLEKRLSKILNADVTVHSEIEEADFSSDDSSGFEIGANAFYQPDAKAPLIVMAR